MEQAKRELAEAKEKGVAKAVAIAEEKARKSERECDAVKMELTDRRAGYCP